MSESKTGLHPLKTVRYVILGVVLCLLVGLGGFLGGRYWAGRQESSKISAAVVESRLTQISELASVTYTYTNVAQFESSNDFYGVTIPFTTKRFLLAYDGEIKAGVDLGEAEIRVTEDEVTITLPDARILSHQIDEDSVEIFDEKTSIFNPFTIEDFTAFQAEQKALVEEKALDRGLLTEAKKAAADSVRLLLGESLPEDMELTIS